MVIIAPLDTITDTSLLSCAVFPGLDGCSIYFWHSGAHHNCIILVVVLESVRVGKTSVLSFVCPVISRNRDAPRTPSVLIVASRTYDTLLLTRQTSIVIVVVIGVSSSSNDLADQPAPADVLTIHHTTISQLDALSCPIYPSKVEVEQRLDDAKGKADGEDIVVSCFSEAAEDPIEDIEGAVGTESDEVEAVDDSRDWCLAEE
jgi:hypothetical protein